MLYTMSVFFLYCFCIGHEMAASQSFTFNCKLDQQVILVTSPRGDLSMKKEIIPTGHSISIVVLFIIGTSLFMGLPGNRATVAGLLYFLPYL